MENAEVHYDIDSFYIESDSSMICFNKDNV